VARSLELGLLPLRGSEAHLRWSGTERGGWRTRFEAHSGARDGEKAGRWQQSGGRDKAWWRRCSSPRERERRAGMGVVEDGGGSAPL
jgi:hypothetical protein